MKPKWQLKWLEISAYIAPEKQKVLNFIPGATAANRQNRTAVIQLIKFN